MRTRTAPLARAGGRFGADLRAALPAWVAARLLVALAWLVAVVAERWRDNAARIPLDDGLLAWDGTFYRAIAEHGYHAGWEGLRFFPGFPLAGRALGFAFGGDERWALIVLANGAALVGAALLVRLVRVEGGGRAAGVRAAWLVSLVPPAFVLAWGYSEAFLLVATIGCFLALRRRRWGTAAVAGLVAGFVRPTGALLALPALVEAARCRGQRGLGGRLAAVAAPLAGSGAYLLWLERRFGDGYAPIRIQADLRGGFVDPVTRLIRSAGEFVGSERFNDGLHFPFAVALVVLAVLVWRRLPLSYAVFSTAVVVIALSADNLNSIERYGFVNGFPLVMALALAAHRRAHERWLLAVSAAGLVGMATLAWLGELTP